VRTRKNIWPFGSKATSARNTTPASGGIAAHAAKRRSSGGGSKRSGGTATPAKAAPLSYDEKALDAHFKKGGTLAEFLRQNPGADVDAITDRAKRYRAQKNVTGPRKCVMCGSTRNLDVMHLSGNESDGGRKNLAYGCRSCNTTLGHAFKRIGAGRPTRQYNPASGAVPTFAQYTWAVSQGGPGGRNHSGEHDEAGAIIHATPKSKRIDYARRIAEGRTSRARAAFDERWNPADAAAAGYKDFHGAPPSEFVEVKERVHIHKYLSGAGVLKRLVVAAIDGKAEVKLSGFGKECLLAFNEKRNQLFIVGGDQSVDLAAFGIDPDEAHELETLGRVTKIGYHTTKDHLGDEGGEALYLHVFRMTNENGRHVTVRVARYPDLIYRVRDEKLEFSGGSYTIIPEGIDR
jgi:hypothetical protein